MIEFKIISSPDKSQQSSYQHLGQLLVFGKSEGDMVIDDPAFGPSQLRIKVDGDKIATIENLNPSTEVRLNGKPIASVMPLKEKDNVTIARTTINFSRLDLAPLPAPDVYENPNAKERFTPGSKEQAVMDVLQFLEQNYKDSAGGPPPLPGAAKPPLPPGASPPPLPGGLKPPPLPPRKP